MLSVAVLARIAAAVVCALAITAQAATSKERFDAIMTNLDTGGDVLFVANLEGVVQGVVSNLSQLLTAIPAPGADGARLRATIAKVPGFLDRNGFFAVQGVGASVVPRGDGLNNVKTYLARDRAAADTRLWRALVGGEPRELTCARFLPADTVIARTGTGEIPQLWALIRAGITDFASPKANTDFERQLTVLSTNLGVRVETLIASLGTEGFFSLQLSQTATVALPLGGPNQTPTKIPSPSLLIGIAVKDGTLAKAVEKGLARSQLPLQTSPAGSVPVTSTMPLPSPVPLQPTFAVCSNFFLFGSTPTVVSDAIAAFQSGKGLTATDEFKKAFEGLPTKNNGIFYQSPRFARTLAELMANQMDAAGRQPGPAFMQAFCGGKPDMRSAFVFLNTPDGVRMAGVSTSGGKELAGSVMTAPVGLLAGIAIPSFVKARSTASQNACINNLRQIDSAKEQWALEMKKKDGDPVDIPGISRYIKGNRLPKCPQGGVYNVGVIGKNPECSVPGHAIESP